MTIKYYTSVSLFKSFSVKRKNGWETQIIFKFNNTLKCGEYITEDEELQELIEKRREFKKGEIVLQNTIKTEEPVKVEHVDVQPNPEIIIPAILSPVEEVMNINEAKEYLRNKGVPHQKLRTPEAIKSEAEKLYLTFPNVKL